MVSVLMTVRNGERFISESIDSVLGQTFDDFELIIIDDKSDDGTSDIISEFQKSDSRVICIRNDDNRGAYKSLNIGINASNGTYISILDSDDLMLKDRLERQVDFLENNPEYGLVGCAIDVIDEHGTYQHTQYYPTDHEGAKKALPRRNAFNHPSVMYRRNLAERIGGYDEKYRNSMDYDLCIKLSSVSKSCNLRDVLTKYRVHSSNASKKNIKIQSRAAVYVLLNAIKRGDHSIYHIIYVTRFYFYILCPTSIVDFWFRTREFKRKSSKSYYVK